MNQKNTEVRNFYVRNSIKSINKINRDYDKNTINGLRDEESKGIGYVFQLNTRKFISKEKGQDFIQVSNQDDADILCKNEEYNAELKCYSLNKSTINSIGVTIKRYGFNEKTLKKKYTFTLVIALKDFTKNGKLKLTHILFFYNLHFCDFTKGQMTIKELKEKFTNYEEIHLS